MDDNIKEKYRHQIQESEIFLASSSRAAARKQWSPLQQNKWLMRQELCPTCDMKLNSQNLTKEHIHPLCIGGAERDDNVIAMCHDCNEARNNTMTAVLGGNNPKSLRDRWPANRSSVEEFVVWCHATVYGDFETVRKLQHIEETFMRWRGLKSSKFLTKRISNKEPQESKFKSFLSKTKSMFSNTKSVFSKPSSKVKIDCENCGETLQLPKGYTGRFKCPSCGHIAGDNPKVNHEPKSTQERNPKKVLSKAKLKPKTATSNDKSVVKKVARTKILQAGSEFPKLTRVNTRGGLKLPREPSEMAEIMYWLFVNDLKYNTWSELKEDLSGQSFITTTPTQLHSTLIKITMWVEADGNFESDDFFELQQKISEIGLEGLFTVVENICRAHKKIEESDFDNIRIYFDEVRKSLPHGRFSNFVLSKLSETGKIDLGALSKPHLDEFIESEGFSTLTELKSTMGYSRNSKLKKIIEDLCGARVKFTLDPNDEKKIFIELAD